MKKLFLFLTGLLGLLHAHSQAVSPDATFAGKGWTYTDFEKGNYYMEMGQQVLLQKDGSYIVVIQLEYNSLVLARYLSNGALDHSFGTNGYSEPTPMSSFDERQAKTALQSDGKIIVAEGTYQDVNQDIMLSRYHVDGSRDKSFGTDGVIRTDVGGRDFALTLAVQSDDRIVVTGASDDYNTGRSYLALVRYTKDGVLDGSFDGDGTLMIERETYEGPEFMAVQNDGKIVLSRNVQEPSSWARSIILTRYNPDGSLDPSFDEDGKLVSDFFENGEVTALAVQGDGKIVLAGRTNIDAENSDFALLRYNNDGSVDKGFGEEGQQTTDFGGEEQASSLAVQSDGKILVLGASWMGRDDERVAIALARYHDDGSPDTSFDGDGKLTTAFGNLVIASSLVVQSDGRIVVAGVTAQFDPIVVDYALARYNPDGSLDNGFDSDGKLTGYYPAGMSQINSLAVQKDGKLVVAGTSGQPNFLGIDAPAIFRGSPAAAALPSQPGAKAGLARYGADGSLDGSFGISGIVTADFGLYSQPTSLVVQADGKIVVALLSLDPEGAAPTLGLARFTADGSLDHSFDGDGKLLTGIYTVGADHSLAVQSDGKIVVAGMARIKDGIVDYVVARYLPDGSPDASFDGDGMALADFRQPAAALSLLLQPDGKIVVTGITQHPDMNTIDLALARFNTDGSLDGSFDGDGLLTTDVDQGDEIAYSLALQADGKIVVTGTTTVYNDYKRSAFLVRYNQDGSLDSSFNGDGKLTTDFFERRYRALAGVTPAAAVMGMEGPCIATQDNGKIVMGGTTYDSATGQRVFGLVRYLNDGSVDSSFGSGGTMWQDFSPDNDIATSLFIAPGRIYQAGYSDGLITRGIVAAYDFDCGDRELCGNRVDDNCDGQVDEGCPNTPFLTINDVTVSEDLQRATLMVTLSKKMSAPVSFSYFTVDRTATSKPNKGARDFESESGTLTIPAGQQTAVISINIIDDNSTEGEEYFDVHLQRPVGAALSGEKGRVTIQDGTPSVGIFLTNSNTGKEEGKEPAGVQQLTATAQPNPSAGAFTLVLQSRDRSPVVIQVTDAAGRLVEAKADLTPNSTLQIGSNYRPGVYYAEVVQGSERVNLKLVKQ